MNDQMLLIPLIACLVGALLAAFFGHSATNRRLSVRHVAFLVALTPLTAFIVISAFLPAVSGERFLVYEVKWMPSLGVSAALYIDSLSVLFGLLVTGIGTLVILYTGYYFSGDQTAWRFLVYMMLFMTAMLGLVMAGDAITLFVFWEATSITSYLLIGYKYKDEEARRGAFKALFITAGGGIPLLVGLLFVTLESGGADFQTILASGDVLRASPWYPAILGLIAFGAFTKSAQTPAHIWLPDAMSAPTPASAFLHSATMVKAGIYLMARLNPALGETELWFWLLSLFGVVTMLTGAYLGLKQNDLKALLAYSTISQLGVLMMLIGQGTEYAFKALVIGIMAHALYKSSLFLVVGIVDHETGTRDLRRLGGLARVMPYSLAIGSVAGLSMAGLPPLFGFLAKETLLATVVHPTAVQAVQGLFAGAAVVSGAFLLAQSGMLIVDTFITPVRDPSLRGHEAPRGMLLAPAIPSILSLVIGVLPESETMATLLASAAANSFGRPVAVSLALWTGITVPLILSVITVSIGLFLFRFRQRFRLLQALITERYTLNVLYAATLRLIDGGAFLVTRTQSGYLRHYLAIMLVAMGLLIWLFRALPSPPIMAGLSLPAFTFIGELIVLYTFTVILAVSSAALTIFLQRDLPAILALGVSGLAIAILMVLEPAPDVALVQIVVDILAVVILVLALTRLPRVQRVRAHELTFRQSRLSLGRDTLIAAGSGLVMAVVVLVALTSRPRESVVTPFYEEGARPLVGATDIVGAILVEFRGFDTLMELAVFSMAGIGVYTLLRYASRTAHDRAEDLPIIQQETAPVYLPPTFQGIAGARTSPFLRAMAYATLPMALMLATMHLMYGHDQPGDGFTAGVIVSLAVGFWYVVLGYEGTKARLSWLQPSHLIGGGLLLALIGGTSAALVAGSFFAPVDFGALLNLPLPRGFHLSTAFFFEVAICLSVLGSVSAVIDTLGHPQDDDPESLRQLRRLTQLEKEGKISLPELIEMGGDGESVAEEVERVKDAV